MSPEPHLGRWAATALKLVAGLATGILLLLAAILAPLFGLLARVAYRPATSGKRGGSAWTQADCAGR